MSILEAIQSNTTEIPLNLLSVFSREYLVERRRLNSLIEADSVDSAANLLLDIVQKGLVNPDDPQFSFRQYDEILEDCMEEFDSESGDFSIEDVSAEKTLDGFASLSEDDLRRVITPLWLYVRSRIRSRYQDNGTLVDVKTGSDISSADVRVVKAIPATKDVIATLPSLRDENNFILFASDSGRALWSDQEGYSDYVSVTASKVIILDERARYSSHDWVRNHNPADPYGPGMPSARSVAHTLSEELSRYGKTFMLTFVANALIGVPCHEGELRLVLEDGSREGKTIYKLDS